MNESIAVLQRRLDALRLLRSERMQYVEAHKAIVSPIRRLPPEILRLIYKNILQYIPITIDPAHLRLSPQWALTHVSSFWRAVAVSTSELWCFLSIDDEVFWKHRIPVLDTILARSSTSDLFLDLQLHYYANNPLLEMLFSHSSRWCEVSIACTYPSIPDIFRPNRPFTNLRNLTITCEPTTIPEDISGKDIGVVSLAPDLQYLCLVSIPTRCFDIPWDQLRVLHLYNDEGMEILHRTTHLKSLLVSGNGPPLQRHLQLPDLQSINQVDAGGALQSLTLPSLRKVVMSGGTENTEQLAELIDRSSCTIRRLTLHRSDEGGAIDILPLMPKLDHLRYLALKRSTLDAASLEAMTFARSSLFALPRLRTLELDTSKFDSRTFAMIYSRTRGNTFLTEEGNDIPPVRCLERIIFNSSMLSNPSSFTKRADVKALLVILDKHGVEVTLTPANRYY
ncbi:hypothetical protein HGRIS_005536 [Hohenbuehelia grisea]|uniref:F-box domain-containing protein n=1 Tax=Hohenbuehelia grisea TaxID=104357 RepID=A0ABR3JX48_9AGAR